MGYYTIPHILYLFFAQPQRFWRVMLAIFQMESLGRARGNWERLAPYGSIFQRLAVHVCFSTTLHFFSWDDCAWNTRGLGAEFDFGHILMVCESLRPDIYLTIKAYKSYRLACHSVCVFPSNHCKEAQNPDFGQNPGKVAAFVPDLPQINDHIYPYCSP